MRVVLGQADPLGFLHTDLASSEKDVQPTAAPRCLDDIHGPLQHTHRLIESALPEVRESKVAEDDGLGLRAAAEMVRGR